MLVLVEKLEKYLLALITLAALTLTVVFAVSRCWLMAVLAAVFCVIMLVETLMDGLKKGKHSKVSSGLPSVFVVVAVALVVIMPMGLCPQYNGEVPRHRDQYEVMAESILSGSLSLNYDDVDPKLEAMDNPYDPEARKAANVQVHWDSAYYKGKYYMYFGVVPVIMLFAPYRAITGMSLTTYHGTQVFAVLYLIGLFLLLETLRKAFFPDLEKRNLRLFFAAAGTASCWYIVSAPALYCTAITSAMCMEVWSLFFFCRAVWIAQGTRKQIGLAFLGSVFGALAVGCRPTVAIANLLVIPMIVSFVKKRHFNFKLFLELVLAALPYVLIIAALLYYNYLRFEAPFEFGQSYQLTVADQHQYGSLLVRLLESNYFPQLGNCLAGVRQGLTFPGLIWEFPLLIAILAPLFGKCGGFLKEKGLRFLYAMMLVVPLAIILSQCIASPYLLERYKSDEMWLLFIAAFFAVGALRCTISERMLGKFERCLHGLCVFAIIASVVLFFVPNDGNFSTYCLHLNVTLAAFR